MAILNMNYSVSGSGGGNIGEPLNLTVTSAGLDATITWEDNEIGTIPPTTFQKSELVRKIGSAPTSPSDGVLVVTETVKDTYKTTGYVDQGLTDGETYYYVVFSYSDLGGISYCDAVSVTPSGGGWQPGANTIAYYPLTSTSTVNDMSGNSRNLTNSGASFGNYVGVDCSYLNGNAYLSGSLPSSHTTWSISYRYYPLASKTSGWHQNVWVDKNNNYSYGTGFYADNKKIEYGYYNGSWHINADVVSYTGDKWHHIITTYDGTSHKLYVNGELKTTNTGWTVNNAWDRVAIGWRLYPSAGSAENDIGYMSNVIIENKAWTAQEISDYFNQTKGDYGIS